MKYIYLVLLSFILCPSALAQKGGFAADGSYYQINRSDQDKPIPAGFGLEHIFVLKSLGEARLYYETPMTNTVSIYGYTTSMADKQELVRPTTGQSRYPIPISNDGQGIMVNDNGEWFSIWTVDYSQHKPQLIGIRAEEADDRCEALKLVIDKHDEPLEFRGTGGQLGKIDRRYDISYKIQKWDESNFEFVEIQHLEENLRIGTELILSGDEQVPNMNTTFVIRGDQFGKKFGDVVQKESAMYQAVRVEANTRAIQTSKKPDEGGDEANTLGGSAPVDIDFFGYGTDAVRFYTWFVYNKKDMVNAVARYTDKNFSYTFEQYGDYEVVLEVANAESSCVTTQHIPVAISESELKIPNFFRPGNSSGSLHEFKVKYKSLVKYHCVIFNRWGNKVFESRDPEQAWNGRYKGQLVNPGVYFYSIVAKGADGINYKKGGDINILH